MKYLKAYRNFINSRNVNEGLRFTTGIALPAFVMSYFGLLGTGIVMSVGALCVAATDNPGPIHHRINGMLVCNVLIFFTAIIISVAFHSVFILGIILFIFCFLFSMLSVYGTRESSIGIASLLMMVLNLQHPKQGWDIIFNALYIVAGGVWFLLYSVLLHKVKPYKVIQQSLGEYIESTADYLRRRAVLYNKHVHYNEVYQQLLSQQANVQQKQDIVSELLFKNPSIAEQNSRKGRRLIMVFLDVADIFERAMTSFQHHKILHDYFDTTLILDKCNSLLLLFADELVEISIAVKSGVSSKENLQITEQIKSIKDYYDELRTGFMSPHNLEGFVGMGRIIESLQDLYERINNLHQYIAYNRKLTIKSINKIPYDVLIEHKEIEPSVFLDNLNFKSNIFRHSLRVSVAVLISYVISLLLHTGHSYWILLTIIVILKPAYSLTKKRNKDRIIGTLCGVLVGILIIFIIKNNIALLVLMIVFMAGCYIFLRTNYFVSVLLMTPYLLIFFHLMYPADFRALLTDRLIDTALGSCIAFVISIFFIPAWEHTTVKTYLIKMLEDACTYYTLISSAFYNEQPVQPGKFLVARKNAFVALANLSDSFTRMSSEPKRHQKGIKYLRRLVVLNHLLISHISTLSYYIQTRKNYYQSPVFEPVSKNTIEYFFNAIATLEAVNNETYGFEKQSLEALNNNTKILMEKRKEELQKGVLETSTKNELVQTKSVTDQFNYIYSIAEDINKVCKEIK